jgi:hypothetical protein
MASGSHGIVTCTPIARQHIGKQVPAKKRFLVNSPFLGYATIEAMFSMSSAPSPELVTDQSTRSLTRDTCFLWGPCREDIREYGPEKDCAGKGQQHIQKTDPSSRQRGRPTKTRP